MASIGLSNRIRKIAQEKYVNPAVSIGRAVLSIRVRDLIGDLQAEGFPAGYTPQICSALGTKKFLQENGLEIEEVKGPPSKVSPTVVFWYRVARPVSTTMDTSVLSAAKPLEETPESRALRLTEKLRGLLKEELTEYGGGEAFLRWVRSEDEDAA